MKNCPFCKSSIDKSSEKCPVCSRVLIERIPSLQNSSTNTEKKTYTPPPHQKTYTYNTSNESKTQAKKQSPKIKINVLGSVAFFIVSSLILNGVLSYHSSPQTTTTPIDNTASMVPQVTAPVIPPVSLPTGTVLYSNPSFFNGNGKLTIKNGSGSDAVIKLIRNSHSVKTVYIDKGDSYTITDIEDGVYMVWFAFGTNWDKTNLTFLQDQSFQKFDDTFDITTTETSTEYTYSHYTVTLNPVIGGTATTTDINQTDFNAY